MNINLQLDPDDRTDFRHIAACLRAAPLEDSPRMDGDLYVVRCHLPSGATTTIRTADPVKTADKYDKGAKKRFKPHTYQDCPKWSAADEKHYAKINGTGTVLGQDICKLPKAQVKQIECQAPANPYNVEPLACYFPPSPLPLSEPANPYNVEPLACYFPKRRPTPQVTATPAAPAAPIKPTTTKETTMKNALDILSTYDTAQAAHLDTIDALGALYSLEQNPEQLMGDPTLGDFDLDLVSAPVKPRARLRDRIRAFMKPPVTNWA